MGASNYIPRSFSDETFKDIFQQAQVLKEHKGMRAQSERALSLRGDGAGVEDNSVQTLYRAGEELDVEKEFLDQAMSNYFLSREKIMGDLRRFKSSHSSGDEFKKEFMSFIGTRVVNKLKQDYPGDNFNCSLTQNAINNNCYIFQIMDKGSRFFRFSNHYLAECQFHCFSQDNYRSIKNRVDVHCLDPVFLHSCGDLLGELKEEISRDSYFPESGMLDNFHFDFHHTYSAVR